MSLMYEPINLEKQQAYLAYLNQCPQKTSDYSFINIWAWSEEYGLRWAWEKDLIHMWKATPQASFSSTLNFWQWFLSFPVGCTGL